MEDIRVSPDKIWDYFVANRDRLETIQFLIAQNDSMEVYLTNDDGTAVFTVYVGEDPVSDYESYSQFDIEGTYKLALSEIGIDIDDDDNDGFDDFTDRILSYYGSEEADEEETEEEFDIRCRERELNNAVQNLIYDVLDDNIDDVSTEEIEQATFTIKEMVCDILAKQYHMPVYRPMFLITDKGERFFTEFPYPSIIDDSDVGI